MAVGRRDILPLKPILHLQLTSHSKRSVADKPLNYCTLSTCIAGVVGRGRVGH